MQIYVFLVRGIVFLENKNTCLRFLLSLAKDYYMLFKSDKPLARQKNTDQPLVCYFIVYLCIYVNLQFTTYTSVPFILFLSRKDTQLQTYANGCLQFGFCFLLLLEVPGYCGYFVCLVGWGFFCLFFFGGVRDFY